MNLLNRLTIWQKLAALVVAMSAPSILLGFFYLRAAEAQVALAQNEIEAARYIQAVGTVLVQVAGHRGTLFAVLTGDTAARAALAAAESAIDRRIDAVDVLDAAVGARFNVTESWRSIRSEWQQLRSAEAKLTPDEAIARHNALLARIRSLDEALTTGSGLNVDPSANTAEVIRVATNDVPTALIASGDVSFYATRASIKGYLGADDRTAIGLSRNAFQQQIELATHDIEHATDGARFAVQPKIEAARQAFAAFFAVLRSRILDAQKMDITGAEVFTASHDMSAALQDLADVSCAKMNAAVRQRLRQVTTWRNLTAGITAVALACALALSWLITRALAQPLAGAISVFRQIEAGKYDNDVACAGSDEAAQVLQALERMQHKLRTQIEAERAAAAENMRIRQALEKVSTSVLLADAQHRILYVNETAQASFARTQNEIRKTLPGFDAQRLPGSAVECLSSEPVQQRQALQSLAGPSVDERQLGACTFRIATNPVMDGSGERIGTVMEWTDRTPEIAVEKQMQAMLAAVVGGDLSSRIDLQGKSGFFEAMAHGLNHLADNMAEVIAKVKAVAAEVHRGAEEISGGNANLSQRTEEQSSSLEETASSMEEMTTTVKQNADNAGQANQLAIAAREQAEHGGVVVNQAVAAMNDINDAAKKIADIIGVIDDIAFQTNLLALNAAVEAARAGEQGRGFAVVASEVRSLAGRSATAAKEIKELIQNSVRKVQDGATLVTRSGETLERIVASVKKVSDIVAEIAAASSEQSAGIEQVNRAVMQMDELTQQNAALVEEATAASQAMAEQVRGLNQLLERYGLEDGPRALPPPGTAQAAPNRQPGAQPSLPGRERRGANRPWREPVAASRATRGDDLPHRPRVGTDRAADSDWREF
ncbi:MAG TPA: methyl-accepting chemotaxis protein [Steroidobacteraceae bacterium]